MTKKIIAFLSSFAIVVSLLSGFASAAFAGGVGRISDFWSLSYEAYHKGFSDWNPGGIFDVDGVGRGGWAEAYSDYLTTLDATEASASVSITGFSAGWSGTSGYGLHTSLKNLALAYGTETMQLFESLGVNSKVLILSVGSTSPYYLLGYYFDETGCLCEGRFVNPVGRASTSLLGVYSLSDLELDASVVVSFGQFGYGSTSYSSGVYYSKSYAELSADFETKRCCAFYFDGCFSPSESSTYPFYFSVYPKSASDSTWSSSISNSFTLWKSFKLSVTGYLLSASTVVWDNSRVVVAPSGVDETSRTSSLMQALDAYNAENMYDRYDTAVNYMIGTQASDGSVTDVYSPALYDEETLIFTEPVTGTQYQTTGWKYDYNLRAYELSLSSGTFTLDGSDITTIMLIYGDDDLIAGYYAGDTLVKTDTYAYVMVSQSECNINGHTNAVETTKEPTCIAVGERTYTCSVCGNQTVEEIPMTDHAYEFSVLREATCVGRGIDLYSCSTCGDEHTETTEALGHDFQPTSIVDTVYSFPDGVSCPSCSGMNYTYARSNSVYDCSCADCGSEWSVDAEISYGATTYTCSRCGEIYVETEDEEDGLFSALARFLSDGITWVTDKFVELTESLNGIHTTFQSYMEKSRNVGGDFPTMLGAAIACMPEDFMGVVWFGVIAMVVVAVYCKFFK